MQKLEELITEKGPHKTTLLKLHKHLTDEKFNSYRKMYKKIPTASANKKVKPIFTDVSCLGLMNNPEFENFFKAFCDDCCNIKHARLNRNLFKQFLQERYSKVVGEKILTFLDSQF